MAPILESNPRCLVVSEGLAGMLLDTLLVRPPLRFYGSGIDGYERELRPYFCDPFYE